MPILMDHFYVKKQRENEWEKTNSENVKYGNNSKIVFVAMDSKQMTKTNSLPENQSISQTQCMEIGLIWIHTPVLQRYQPERRSVMRFSILKQLNTPAQMIKKKTARHPGGAMKLYEL